MDDNQKEICNIQDRMNDWSIQMNVKDLTNLPENISQATSEIHERNFQCIENSSDINVSHSKNKMNANKKLAPETVKVLETSEKASTESLNFNPCVSGISTLNDKTNKTIGGESSTTSLDVSSDSSHSTTSRFNIGTTTPDCSQSPEDRNSNQPSTISIDAGTKNVNLEPTEKEAHVHIEDNKLMQTLASDNNEKEKTNPLHTCNECLKSYKTMTSLKRHLKTHKCDTNRVKCEYINGHKKDIETASVKEKYYKCNTCNDDSDFSNMLQLKMHYRTKHSEYNFKAEVLDSETKIKVEIENKSSRKVKKCKRLHEKGNTIDKGRSKRTKHREENNTQNETNKRQQHKKMIQNLVRNQPLDKRNKTIVKCENCDETFSHKSQLKTHHNTEHKVKLFNFFQCDYCPKNFSLNRNLVRHQEIKHPPGGLASNQEMKVFQADLTLSRDIDFEHEICVAPDFLQCEECEQCFASPTLLNIHQAEKHVDNNDDDISCNDNFKDELINLPQKRNNDADNKRNKSKISNKIKYECKQCCECFSFKREFMKHERSCVLSTSSSKTGNTDTQSNGNKTMKYKCSECPKYFKCKDIMTKHIAKIHSHLQSTKVISREDNPGNNSHLNNLSINNNLNNTKSNNEKKFQCKYCFTRFSLKRNIKRHIDQKHQEEVMRENEQNHAIQTATGILEEESHELQDEDFDPDSPFQDDDVKNKNNKQYICTQCGKNYHSLKYLKVHIRLHTGERPYKCKVCEKSFASSKYLREHIKIHTGERPHTCTHNNCGKAFRVKAALRIHERTHTGEKMFACDECGTCFSQLHILHTHKKFKHSNATREFACDECELRFCQRSDLKKHKRRHTGEKPYQCDECGQCFTRRQNLRQHTLSHGAVKPHQCDLCQRGFLSKRSLKVHSKIHSGGNGGVLVANQCEECGLKFRNAPSLREHKMTQHSTPDKRQESLHINNQIGSKNNENINWVKDGVTTSNTSLQLLPPNVVFNWPKTVATVKSPSYNLPGICVSNVDMIRLNDANKTVFKCQECSKSFDLEAELHLHRQTSQSCGLHYSANTGSGIDTYDISDYLTRQQHQVNSTMGAINSSDNQVQNLAMVTRNDNSIISTSVSEFIETSDGSNKMFKCNECEQCFTCDLNLNQHKILNHNTKPKWGEHVYNYSPRTNEFIMKNLGLSSQAALAEKQILYDNKDIVDTTNNITASEGLVNMNLSISSFNLDSMVLESMPSAHSCGQNQTENNKLDQPVNFSTGVNIVPISHTTNPVSEINSGGSNKNKVILSQTQIDDSFTVKGIESCTDLLTTEVINLAMASSHNSMANQVIQSDVSITLNTSVQVDSGDTLRNQSNISCDTNVIPNYDHDDDDNDTENDLNTSELSDNTIGNDETSDKLLKNKIAKSLKKENTNIKTRFKKKANNKNVNISRHVNNTSKVKLETAEGDPVLENTQTKNSFVEKEVGELNDQMYIIIEEKEMGGLNDQMYTYSEEEDKYTCTKCKDVFASLKLLTRHLRKHYGQKLFRCKTCLQSFASLGNLRVHFRIHTGEKPFQCTLCGKCFNCKASLNNHNKMHTGEKKKCCDECGACFAYTHTLKTHKRFMHSGEKPYECDTCKQRFCQRSDLKNHMRRHTGEKPFQCKECGQCFTRSTNLSQHQRIHSGIKPHPCPQCRKSFITSGRLRFHIRGVHNQERPYMCAVCEKCFSNSASLKGHCSKHHGGVTNSVENPMVHITKL